MAGRIATVSGTMLAPGVSKNRRLYTRELIAKAAARMAQRIADPDGLPIVMRTHHDAGDDSARIVGRLTSVKVGEDGAARYTADLYDTAHGRDIASLVVPDKGQPPALKSVSIHGYWLGQTKRVQYEGESVMTGDDLEIDAVDFTATPGVDGASVTAASYLPDRQPTETAAARTPISESAEATVEAVTEEAPADEGYNTKQRRQMASKGQAMGDGSYPVKNKADLRRAIRAVGRGGADHDAIRKHIIARAKALGLSAMIPDNWNSDGSLKETATRLGEIREYYPDGPDNGAGFCIDAYNGPISLTMRAGGIDPAELRVITAAAMKAAVDALQAMDPDMDADIDVPGAPHADTDGDMAAAGPDGGMESAPADPQSAAETASAVVVGDPMQPEHLAALKESGLLDGLQPGDVVTAAMVNEALPKTSPAAPAEETTETTDFTEVPAVSEPMTPAAETASTPTPAPVIALTQEQFAALLDRITPAREAAPAPEQPAAETAPPAPEPVAETEDQRIARLVAEGVSAAKDELREQLLRDGAVPARKGFRVHESEQPVADKVDREQLFADRAEILLGGFARTPQPAQ